MKRIEVILGLPHEGKTTKLINMFVDAILVESDKPVAEKKALVFITAEETTVSIINILVDKIGMNKDIALKLPIYAISQYSEIEPILLEYLKDNDAVLFLDEPQLLIRNKKYYHMPLHTKLEILCTTYPVDDYKSLDIVYTKSIVRK